jgi:hypothetical protein
VALLYVEYDVLTQRYPAWTLTELKTMPHRERAHWLAVSKWRQDRERL